MDPYLIDADILSDRHIERYISTQDHEPILVWCYCAIGEDHDFQRPERQK